MNDSVSRFWEHYILKTKRYALKDPAVRWYVRHAEEYIKRYSSVRLRAHTADMLTSYLSEKGRNAQLKDWQYKQIVYALKILFKDLLNVEFASNYPWTTRRGF